MFFSRLGEPERFQAAVAVRGSEPDHAAVGTHDRAQPALEAADLQHLALPQARFVDANRFSANHVKVVTEASVVYLLGLVTQREANEAINIARTTSGVKRVINCLEIISDGEARAIDSNIKPSGTPATRTTS